MRFELTTLRVCFSSHNNNPYLDHCLCPFLFSFYNCDAFKHVRGGGVMILGANVLFWWRFSSSSVVDQCDPIGVSQFRHAVLCTFLLTYRKEKQIIVKVAFLLRACTIFTKTRTEKPNTQKWWVRCGTFSVRLGAGVRQARNFHSIYLEFLTISFRLKFFVTNFFFFKS